jgi:hypothetical protein
MRFMFARLFLIAAFAVVLPQLAGAQDACTVDSGVHVGSPACPYQWVGATTATFSPLDDGLGFVGMTTTCRAEFGAGARMCTSKEIMDSDTLNLLAIPAGGCWVRPSWVGSVGSDESGLNGNPGSLSCQSGTALILDAKGRFATSGCSTDNGAPLPVACCKPTPIPEPSASLSLPMGALGLVGLSMMKGGA